MGLAAGVAPAAVADMTLKRCTPAIPRKASVPSRIHPKTAFTKDLDPKKSAGKDDLLDLPQYVLCGP